jgi:hypothetical protein
VSGFSGRQSEPGSITLRYGHPWAPAEAQVTTYPGDPLDDLAELVETSLCWEWWSVTNRPAQPPAARAAARHFTITGSLDQKPNARDRARTRAIGRAIESADKRRTVVPVDGAAADAYLVELPGLCALGLHLAALTALVVGRALAPEALELGLTTDLPRWVGDRPEL